MKPVNGNIQEIRDWFERVKHLPIQAMYGDGGRTKVFAIQCRWYILVDEGGEEEEVIGNRGTTATHVDAASLERGTDTFAIVDDALVVLEVNEKLPDRQLYVCVIVPTRSSFDLDHVTALVRMGLMSGDAVRIVAEL